MSEKIYARKEIKSFANMKANQRARVVSALGPQFDSLELEFS